MQPDPYSPPAARIGDILDDSAPRKRPALVWVIVVYEILGVVGLLVSTVLLAAGILPLAPGLEFRIDLAEYGMITLISLIQLTGAILLFRLKARAPDFQLAALVLLLASNAYQYLTSPFYVNSFKVNWIGNVAGFALSVAIVLYAYHLRRRGTLR